MKMDSTQTVQEGEYEFPYHYLPEVTDEGFRWWPYWSWGYKYLTGIEMVLSKLDNHNFDKLVDVGCGDGRFIREVSRIYKHKQLTGIDYSERAIRLANALNPGLDYRSGDITSGKLNDKYDVVTLIEVLEHIPPDDVTAFVESLSDIMDKNSMLIVTVPHTNQEIIPKHYQHFNSISLSNVFSERFEIESFFYFDRKSRVVSWIQRLLFNKYYVVRHQKLLNNLYEKYRKKYLRCDEPNCYRIGAVMKLK